MDKFRRGFLQVEQNIVYALFAVIALYMLLTSLFSTCVMVYTDEHTYYLKDFGLLIFAGLLVLTVLLTWLRKCVVEKRRAQHIVEISRLRGSRLNHVLLVMTLLWVILQVAMILNTKLHFVYDQSRVYEGARELLAGDYTNWKPFNYFYAYPYINGMVLMEVPFVFLFGDNAYLALQFANIIFLLLIFLAISFIAKLIFDRRAAQLTYLALLLFAPLWFYVTFGYGTIPGLAFCCWALYFERSYEHSGKWKELAASLVLVFLGVAWKSNFQIFLIALAILFLSDAIRKGKWQPLVGAAGALLFLGTELTMISALMHLITGEAVNGGTPTIAWVAMGLQESSIAPGWYNGYTEKVYQEYNYIAPAITQDAKHSIIKQLTLFHDQPDYGLRFFFRKLASMWNNPSFQCFTIVSKRNTQGSLSYWMKDLLYDGGVKNVILQVLMDLMHSITLFGLVLYAFLRKRRTELCDYALLLTFLGGFFFHIVWEAMGQYALPFYLLLFPYAVQGYLLMTRKLLESWERFARSAKTDRKKYLYALTKTGLFRRFVVLTVVILILTFSNAQFLTSTIKLQGGEKDYIWYCTHETEWKDPGYVKV